MIINAESSPVPKQSNYLINQVTHIPASQRDLQHAQKPNQAGSCGQIKCETVLFSTGSQLSEQHRILNIRLSELTKYTEEALLASFSQWCVHTCQMYMNYWRHNSSCLYRTNTNEENLGSDDGTHPSAQASSMTFQVSLLRLLVVSIVKKNRP